MQGLWQCLGCAGLLVSALLAQPASANREVDDEYEVHWITKSPSQHLLTKRKAVCQIGGWSLCPASVGGGCCPNNFECGTSSCFATTAGPTSCGGTVGYYNCPLTLGAGTCCPVNLICDDGGGCIPPVGVTSSLSCPTSWFGCPVSLGGGCCRDSQVCGDNICYEKTPKTLPVSETKTTTDSRGHTTITVVTSTTVITDGPNTSGSSATAVGVAQFVPSTVSKIAAVQTSDSGGGHGGLSSGALGGIIAGVIVVLIIVVVVAIFVILQLKKTEKKVDESAEKLSDSKREGSNSPHRSHKSGFVQPSISEIDSTTDIDPSHRLPFMMPSPQQRSRSATNGTADPSLLDTPNFASSDSSSPPLWSTQFNYASSIPPDGRKASLDSYPRHDNANVRMSQTVSVDSYMHSRQPSDASELEARGVGPEPFIIESSIAEPQRRSNSITRPVHMRRNSDLSGQNRARGDSSATAGPLGTVNEIFDELHGYHGPKQAIAGQTLDRGSSSASSVSSRH
ncbi:hypothetical protein F4825DRAFT_263470 [Nemania diffusa]|nr:hypothetical protein F4825DRAFT_263470 [Nemania diffusa]